MFFFVVNKLRYLWRCNFQFGLNCEENAQFKLTLVGVVHSVARVVSLPIIGIYSDRLGRRTVMAFSLFLSGTFGLIQSFSLNFVMVLVCEFFISSGVASLQQSAVILGMEWSNIKHRNIVVSLLTVPLYLGFVVCGIIAAYTRHFRLYLRFLYLPTLFSVFAVLLGSESLRWLMIKGKRDRALRLISLASKINNCQLSAKSMIFINSKLDAVKMLSDQQAEDLKNNDRETLSALMSSRVLFVRFCVCAFCWATVGYVLQAVNIISVFLPGDKYLNYELIAFGGFPSSFISLFLLKYMGRRSSMALCLFIVSASCVIGKMLPAEYYYVSVSLFVAARCFSLLAQLLLNIQSSELWPTPLRQTMSGLLATFGKSIAILSPLAPLLVCISHSIPLFAYSHCFILDFTVEHFRDASILHIRHIVTNRWTIIIAVARDTEP